MKFGRRNRISQEQFDNAAKALYEFMTGSSAGNDFIKVENDQWFVLARVCLEGAGVRVP